MAFYSKLPNIVRNYLIYSLLYGVKYIFIERCTNQMKFGVTKINNKKWPWKAKLEMENCYTTNCDMCERG